MIARTHRRYTGPAQVVEAKPIPIETIHILWEKTNGKAWEPPDPGHETCYRLIHEGWVRRTDGRCGFELIPGAMLTWTTAARQYFELRNADELRKSDAADATDQGSMVVPASD